MGHDGETTRFPAILCTDGFLEEGHPEFRFMSNILIPLNSNEPITDISVCIYLEEMERRQQQQRETSRSRPDNKKTSTYRECRCLFMIGDNLSPGDIAKCPYYFLVRFGAISSYTELEIIWSSPPDPTGTRPGAANHSPHQTPGGRHRNFVFIEDGLVALGYSSTMNVQSIGMNNEFLILTILPLISLQNRYSVRLPRSW
jgi:hypothetical protein